MPVRNVSERILEFTLLRCCRRAKKRDAPVRSTTHRQRGRGPSFVRVHKPRPYGGDDNFSDPSLDCRGVVAFAYVGFFAG